MIYRDSTTSVQLEHPSDGPLAATVTQGLVVLQEETGLTPTDGIFSFDLDWESTESEGQIKIHWTGTDVDRTTYDTILVPILPLSKIQAALSTIKTSDELKAIESAVRTTIENYTGQTFGYFAGTRTAVGMGGDVLNLPWHIESLSDIQGGLAPSYGLIEGGWALLAGRDDTLEIKMAPPEDNVYVVYGVIRVPMMSNGFQTGTVFTLTGEFGYREVPEDIQYAATLLVKDMGSGLPNYGNMGLSAYKAADWTLQWQDGAFGSTSTGNKAVDQILEKYQRPFYGVI